MPRLQPPPPPEQQELEQPLAEEESTMELYSALIRRRCCHPTLGPCTLHPSTAGYIAYRIRTLTE